MRQLTSLDAQFLAVESARTYGHVGGLAVYDPATAPGGAWGSRPVDDVWALLDRCGRALDELEAAVMGSGAPPKRSRRARAAGGATRIAARPR